VLWNADRVVLYYDSDKAGQSVTQASVKAFEPYMTVMIVPDHENDPADSSEEDVAELLGRAKSSVSLSMPWREN